MQQFGSRTLIHFVTYKMMIPFVCVMAFSVTLSCVRLAHQKNSGHLSIIQQESILPANKLRLNINRASREELERLPGIGQSLATRIIEHRERFGPFRRAEHLIIVRGISEKRFRGMREQITVE